MGVATLVEPLALSVDALATLQTAAQATHDSAATADAAAQEARDVAAALELQVTKHSGAAPPQPSPGPPPASPLTPPLIPVVDLVEASTMASLHANSGVRHPRRPLYIILPLA
jgi:hypothetical protein